LGTLTNPDVYSKNTGDKILNYFFLFPTINTVKLQIPSFFMNKEDFANRPIL